MTETIVEAGNPGSRRSEQQQAKTKRTFSNYGFSAERTLPQFPTVKKGGGGRETEGVQYEDWRCTQLVRKAARAKYKRLINE